MQLSIEKNKFENVCRQGLLQECCPSRISPTSNYKTRSWHHLLGGIPNSSITPSLGVSPLIGIKQDDVTALSAEELMNTEVVENGNGLSLESMFEKFVCKSSTTNNKGIIQDNAEFLNYINNADPVQVKEIVKEFFQKKLNSGNENEQLLTPIQTPIEESGLSFAFKNKEDDSSNAPVTPIDILNMNLPILDRTPRNQVISSPDICSPIQPNINTFGLLNGSISTKLPLQSTPYEEPLNVMTITPMLPLQQSPMIQDELNQFKSPAFVDPTASILAPSPVISSPFINQMQIQSTVNSKIHSPTPSLTQDSIDVESILRTLSSNQSSDYSSVIRDNTYGGSIDSSLLNPSTIQFPIDSTPVTTTEPYPNENNDILPIFLTGNNLLNANLETADDESEVLTNNIPNDTSPVITTEPNENNELTKILTGNNLEVADDVSDVLNINKEDLDLEQVDKLLNTLKDNPNIHQEFLEAMNVILQNKDESFPSEEMIKKCMVDRTEFEFSNENITKLVHKAPVELDQEDVIELEKLAKKKRGKGRPRKPKKFTICPFKGCGKKFDREFNLKEHMRTHNPRRSRSHVCSLCNLKFYNSSVLSRHKSSIHDGEEFFCKNCGKKFNRKDALHRHEKTSCH